MRRIVQKGGHFVLFAVIALLLRTRYARRWEHVLLFTVTAAVLTETLQHFSSGRAPSFRDIGIDLAGVAVAWMLARLVVERGASVPAPGLVPELVRVPEASEELEHAAPDADREAA